MADEITIKEAAIQCDCQASYITKLIRQNRITARRAAPGAHLWLLSAADVAREAEVIRKNREARDGGKARNDQGRAGNRNRRRPVRAKARRGRSLDQG